MFLMERWSKNNKNKVLVSIENEPVILNKQNKKISCIALSYKAEYFESKYIRLEIANGLFYVNKFFLN
jgi:hypothetical protein